MAHPPRSFEMRSVRLAVVVVILLVVTTSNAQQATTSVRGTVQDPKGAVIPNAKVTIANPAIGFSRSTTADAEGFYQFLALPPGTYDLTAEASNVGKVTEKSVHL